MTAVIYVDYLVTTRWSTAAPALAPYQQTQNERKRKEWRMTRRETSAVLRAAQRASMPVGAVKL